MKSYLAPISAFILFSVLAVPAAFSAPVTLIYDESVSGDLDYFSTTTVGTFVPGVNIIKGQGSASVVSGGAFQHDLDAAHIDMAAGFEITAFNAVMSNYLITGFESLDHPASLQNTSATTVFYYMSMRDGTVYKDMLPTSGLPTYRVTTIAGSGGIGDNFSATWDWEMQVTITSVPIPPALYLFGSGLLGLVGIARRKAVV